MRSVKQNHNPDRLEAMKAIADLYDGNELVSARSVGAAKTRPLVRAALAAAAAGFIVVAAPSAGASSTPLPPSAAAEAERLHAAMATSVAAMARSAEMHHAIDSTNNVTMIVRTPDGPKEVTIPRSEVNERASMRALRGDPEQSLKSYQDALNREVFGVGGVNTPAQMAVNLAAHSKSGLVHFGNNRVGVDAAFNLPWSSVVSRVVNVEGSMFLRSYAIGAGNKMEISGLDGTHDCRDVAAVDMDARGNIVTAATTFVCLQNGWVEINSLRRQLDADQINNAAENKLIRDAADHTAEAGLRQHGS